MKGQELHCSYTIHSDQKARALWSVAIVLACVYVTPTPPALAQDVHLGLPAGSSNSSSQTTRQQALAAVGKTLFFDRRLSANGSVSCATCHQPARAFTDGRPLAQGINARLGSRNTPTLLNAAYNLSQFWDGRRATLEEQAADPFFNPLEHGLKDQEALLRLVRRIPDYRKALSAAFNIAPAEIGISHVSKSIAAYEATLVAGDSAFDRYYFGKDQAALSPAAQRGLTLFTGQARCASCHLIGKDNALFSDNRFHSMQIGLDRIAGQLPSLTARLVQARQQGVGLDQTVLGHGDIAELGRFVVTLEPSDIGAFRTPGLRNVALTAPYMHDGSVATLAEAISLEADYRHALAPGQLPLGADEKADLLAFLKSLTSPIATGFVGPSKDGHAGRR